MDLYFELSTGEAHELSTFPRFQTVLVGGCSGRAANDKARLGSDQAGRRRIKLDDDALDKVIAEITKPHVNRVKKGGKPAPSMPFEQWPAEVNLECQPLQRGGKCCCMIDGIVANALLHDVSGEFLHPIMACVPVAHVTLDVKDSEFMYGFD